jgi:hypothetical protein
LVVFGLLYFWHKDKEQMKNEREDWRTERKDLLDRIQAPTYAEYTNKVVREKKAEKPEELPEQVEFIS